MPLIPAQPTIVPRETLSVRIDRVIHERLKLYAEFIQSSKEYVISQALRQLFRKDREFAAWLEARKTPAPADDTRTGASLAVQLDSETGDSAAQRSTTSRVNPLHTRRTQER
jgi:hypothetical protein